MAGHIYVRLKDCLKQGFQEEMRPNYAIKARSRRAYSGVHGLRLRLCGETPLTGRERQGVHSGGPERKIAYAQLHWPLKGKTVVIRSAL